MRPWQVVFLSAFASFVIAAPSNATRVCAPEIVKVTVTGKPLVGRTLTGHVRARCAS